MNQKIPSLGLMLSIMLLTGLMAFLLGHSVYALSGDLAVALAWAVGFLALRLVLAFDGPQFTPRRKWSLSGLCYGASLLHATVALEHPGVVTWGPVALNFAGFILVEVALLALERSRDFSLIAEFEVTIPKKATKRRILSIAKKGMVEFELALVSPRRVPPNESLDLRVVPVHGSTEHIGSFHCQSVLSRRLKRFPLIDLDSGDHALRLHNPGSVEVEVLVRAYLRRT